MEKVDITEYIRLYQTGIELNKIKPLRNQTYQIFKMSKAKIKIIDRSNTYKNSAAFSKIKYFVKDNPYFYMIPITTPKGTIAGFLLRGIFNSSYSTISRNFNEDEKQVPLMFGFDSNFIKYDKLSKCYPIIVCEGCKDCLTLKKIYPFVLANNTSKMGVNATILRNISNKFLLAYDNDKAGTEGVQRDKRILRGIDAYVDSISIPEGYKDCTDCVINKDGTINKDGFLTLRKQVLKKLKGLYQI